MLSYGADMTIENNPYELSLGRLVDLGGDVDCISRAALERIAEEGPKQMLVGLALDGEPIQSNDRHWPVLRDGALAGKLTSIAHSPRIGRTIGLAYVPADLSTPGEKFDIATPAGERTAEVVPTPFWDLKKKKA